MSREKRDRFKRVDDAIEQVREEVDEVIDESKTAGSEVREEVQAAISDVEVRIDKPRNRPGEYALGPAVMEASLPVNALAATLADGGVALGILDNTYNPTLVEFYGEVGVDFVWLDLEHGGPDPWDSTPVEDLLRAAERTGVELLVRLPDTDPTLVRKALDLGVRNVFLPRVNTAEEVRKAVRSARFRYDDGPGDRGLGSPRARRWGLAEEYIATEDRETLVGVTVETEASIENLDDILAVPELGFVFVGPLDLSVSLGHPGEIDHPTVQDDVETVRSRAVEAGVPVAGLGFGMDDVVEKASNGYQLLNLGSTTGAIEQTVTSWLDAYAQADA